MAGIMWTPCLMASLKCNRQKLSAEFIEFSEAGLGLQLY